MIRKNWELAPMVIAAAAVFAWVLARGLNRPPEFPAAARPLSQGGTARPEDMLPDPNSKPDPRVGPDPNAPPNPNLPPSPGAPQAADQRKSR